MAKICTDIEQSRKLLELGVDPYTSDMWWDIMDTPDVAQPTGGHYDGYEIEGSQFMPAWSLQALLNLLPSYLKVVAQYGSYWHYLDIVRDQISYGKMVSSPQGELVDCCVSILDWIKDNKERIGFLLPEEDDSNKEDIH